MQKLLADQIQRLVAQLAVGASETAGGPVQHELQRLRRGRVGRAFPGDPEGASREASLAIRILPL